MHPLVLHFNFSCVNESELTINLQRVWTGVEEEHRFKLIDLLKLRFELVLLRMIPKSLFEFTTKRAAVNPGIPCTTGYHTIWFPLMCISKDGGVSALRVAFLPPAIVSQSCLSDLILFLSFSFVLLLLLVGEED